MTSESMTKLIPRISLRFTIVAITLICVIAAWYGMNIRHHNELTQFLHQKGYVLYFRSSTQYINIFYPELGSGGSQPIEHVQPNQNNNVLMRLFNSDYIDSISGVDLRERLEENLSADPRHDDAWRNVDLTTLRSIGSIFDLEWLSLNGGKFEADSLRELTGLKKLKFLDLSNTSICDSDLRFLAMLPSLEELALDNTQIGDEGFQLLIPLTKLKRLTVSNTNLSDEGLKSITCLTKIEVLNISRTLLTDKGIPLLQSLHHLQEIHLHKIEIKGDGIDAIRTLPKLKYIYGLNDIAISEIAKLLPSARKMPNGLQVIPSSSCQGAVMTEKP